MEGVWEGEKPMFSRNYFSKKGDIPEKFPSFSTILEVFYRIMDIPSLYALTYNSQSNTR